MGLIIHTKLSCSLPPKITTVENSASLLYFNRNFIMFVSSPFLAENSCFV